MNVARLSSHLIRQVMIYGGHQQNPVLGPYFHNVEKRIQMFNLLNAYRKELGRRPWKVTVVTGEKIVDELEAVYTNEFKSWFWATRKLAEFAYRK